MTLFKRYAHAASAAVAAMLLVACGGGSSPNAAAQAPEQSSPAAPVPAAKPLTASTFVGDDGQTYVDGVGASVRFAKPTAVAMDGAGNMYISDAGVVRKMSAMGVVSTLAANAGGCPATGPFADAPCALALDNSGNVYVVDGSKNFVRKISPAGVVSTLAGSDTAGFVDGAGGAAAFNALTGVAVDGAGNVYVAEAGNNAVRKISPAGVVSTLAGSGSQGFVDGVGRAASFNSPAGLAVDNAGNVYVADSGNNAIRKITPSGVVSTVAGDRNAQSGLSNGPGLFNGPGAIARFDRPSAVALDAAGNLYVADTHTNTVRKITPDAMVSNLAGSDTFRTSDAYADGVGSQARFAHPSGLAVDGDGNIRVADRDNRVIRTVSPAGAVTTLVGQGPKRGLIDGNGVMARFRGPHGLAFDGLGNLYVADIDNDAIRKITPAGVVTTLAGGPAFYDVNAVDVNARFLMPTSIASDSAGNIYVAAGYMLNRVSAAGVVTTPKIPVVGVQYLAMNGSGTLYIATRDSVFTMSPDGAVKLLSNSLVDAANPDYLSAIAADSAGNVYVANANRSELAVNPANKSVRKISPQGKVTLLASGVFGASGAEGIAVDGAGNVYALSSSELGAVLKIGSDGAVTTVAGGNGTGYANGIGSAARFDSPVGIVVDGAGNVFVSDANNQAIRKLAP